MPCVVRLGRQGLGVGPTRQPHAPPQELQRAAHLRDHPSGQAPKTLLDAHERQLVREFMCTHASVPVFMPVYLSLFLGNIVVRLKRRGSFMSL